MAKREIQSPKALNDLLESSGDNLVVIIFYADWCGPCRSVAPKLEKMAREFPDVVFAKVNIEHAEEVATLFAIVSIPHFKLFKNKKEVSDIRGSNEASLKELIVAWKDVNVRTEKPTLRRQTQLKD
ncbi:thioredoxin-like isoform X2 [Montipora capricornis]|uniref:thioredoxin-like n=1 Tax=Montipora foliosa TaxID=591990 RepID=UPI0035F125E3